MSKSLFKKKKKEDLSPETALTKMRETQLMLEKKSVFIESQIEKQTQIARKNASTNKKVAIEALKRKKRLEKQLQQVDGTLSTVEFQRENLENVSINTEVLQNMSTAAKTLKETHKKLDVENVQDLICDIEEQQQIASEISETLATGFGVQQDEDDDDLLAELEELTNEKLGIEDFPAVPDQPLPIVKGTKEKISKDKDLANLEAWAT
ncbi:Charged multivesicular body protein 4b [Oopsacas minuta]|uniref:Charged multivesicular body protein 4b n=1 Tax=Oopsacas minuta TaxID=111878 RepID=A0AAV7JT24_9METZ|nr:Charged multivesicular body protein 4b [Oopsacas minuta]